MPFSLNNIPRVKEIKKKEGIEKRNTIAKCYAIIKHQDKISPSVREALLVYLTERLKNMSSTNLSSDLFSANIVELLEYCCHKKYDDITEEDVIKNEVEILQQIKWCIEYKNTKRLVWIESEHNIISKSKDSRDLGTINVFKQVNEEEIYDYFEIRRRLYGEQ